jgi:PadR family transcriptional regulator
VWTVNRERPVTMNPSPSEVRYGTRDLMILKTLQAMRPLHGYAVESRIEQSCRVRSALNQAADLSALFRSD